MRWSVVMMATLGVLALGAAGCHKKSVAEVTTDGASKEREARVSCTADGQFPSAIRLPEASAAAEVELVPGTRELLIVSDSGHHGRAIAWAIPGGPARRLSLDVSDGVSDDVEGMAWRDGHIFTLTSSGAVRRYSPDGHGGVQMDGPAYAVGPAHYACSDLAKSNCGKDYEGLCLRDAPPGPAEPPCDGYAASKDKGTLFCLKMNDGKLAIDPNGPALVLPLPKHALSDCAFGARGGSGSSALVVTTNEKGGSVSYVVDERKGELSRLRVSGTAANEAIAIDREGALYQFQDDHTKNSLALRSTCSGW